MAGWLEAHGARCDTLPSGDQWYSHRLLEERIPAVTADWDEFGETPPLDATKAQDIASALSRPFRLRVDADYRPESEIEQADLGDAARDMRLVFEALDSPHGDANG
ncbi:MAG: hypothetical protein HZB16_06040 [Armatimonadetes bacterium]|nr:hypothetical protein [Armatimonadota bacterium]